MSDLFGDKLTIEVRCKKKSNKYSITIIDQGERTSCTELDADGNNINAKIVEYLSTLMSGKESEEASLTQDGQIAHRVAAGKHHNKIEEEEEEDGYDHLNSPKKTNPFDNNYGF